jgi:hypothetical protein
MNWEEMEQNIAKIAEIPSFFGYFLRSTRKCANSFSVCARWPKESSAAQPELINASAWRRDPSMPKSAG